ncbi:MAG TPA: hypothetical protein VKR27_00970 [Acidimicrobiales bacterium]|nr:hypothetical protein [Acidimicrobiales bacterium]
MAVTIEASDLLRPSVFAEKRDESIVERNGAPTRARLGDRFEGLESASEGSLTLGDRFGAETPPAFDVVKSPRLSIITGKTTRVDASAVPHTSRFARPGFTIS